jgi:pyridoxine 5-phosphate synthase
MAARLGVNIDHVATLRQARGETYPDPVEAALIAQTAGADQITCHIRCDRRHVNERDIRLLRGVVNLLNVECAATGEMLGIMEDLRPHRVTLVPERPEEITTEGGLDLQRRGEEVQSATRRLKAAGIHVSLFLDPEVEEIAAAGIDGVDMIELNTARYAETGGGDRELERLALSARRGLETGLEIAAGHGLTHLNLQPLVDEIPEIVEYNIGHSIVARAVFVGLDRAVVDLLNILRGR